MPMLVIIACCLQWALRNGRSIKGAGKGGGQGCRGGDRGREDEEFGEAQVGKSMEGCTDCGSSRQGQGCEKNWVQV